MTRGEGGGQNDEKSSDVICECPLSNIIFFRKYKRIIIIGNMIVLFKQQKRNIRMPKSVKKLWMMQNVDIHRYAD